MLETNLGIDESILVTRDDDDRHLQMSVFVAELTRIRDHEGGLGSGRANLRRTKGHLFRKGFKLFWHGLRAEERGH